jgi:transposase
MIITTRKIDTATLTTRAALVARIDELEIQLLWFAEQHGLAQKRLFGSSSEQTPAGQEMILFDEAEALANFKLPEPTEESVIARRRKCKGQREMVLANLEEEEILYTLPADALVCPACTGPLHEMGTEVRREISIIPAQVKLTLHTRMKYTCRHCQSDEIKTPFRIAPMPEPAFPKSLASASTVAHIMTQKFVEGSPLYRQEQALQREGIQISRQTMANWMLTGAQWLAHLYERMRVHLLKRDILHADETTLQVLREAGRSAKAKSQMWLYRSGRDGPPIVLYEYQPTRAAAHPLKFLKEFCGFLHVDGYAGYEGIPNVTLVGCWSHARRKFDDAIAILPAEAQKKGGTTAHIGMAYCNKLFEIERMFRDVTAEERLAGRLEHSKPIVDAFRVWLDKQSGNVLPKSTLGGAIGYCRKQWLKLSAFLSDGRLELDNNRAERSIKPFVMGRKNWLFANTPRGARASATIYSIIETAKENDLRPCAYLTYLFERLPNVNLKHDNELDALLPWSPAVQATLHVPAKPTA